MPSAKALAIFFRPCRAYLVMLMVMPMVMSPNQVTSTPSVHVAKLATTVIEFNSVYSVF
jgi:hypothetical protein